MTASDPMRTVVYERGRACELCEKIRDSTLVSLISELRRRNVLRMAAIYVVAAWLIMQVAEVVIGLANLPEWIGPIILAELAIGFPIVVLRMDIRGH